MRSDPLLSSVNVVLVMAYGSLVSVFLFISVSFSYLGQVYVNSRDDKPVSVVFFKTYVWFIFTTEFLFTKLIISNSQNGFIFTMKHKICPLTGQSSKSYAESLQGTHS